MTLNPRTYIIIAVVGVLLSGIGAYFAREKTALLETEKKSHTETSEKLKIKEAELVIKESQLKRALSKRTTSTPILVGDKVAYIKTSESVELNEQIQMEYTERISVLEDDKDRLMNLVDTLRSKEVTKPSVKRWGLLGKYNFPHWEAGAGFHQNLGLVDLGLYGLLSVPSLNQYSVALNARF